MASLSSTVNDQAAPNSTTPPTMNTHLFSLMNLKISTADTTEASDDFTFVTPTNVGGGLVETSNTTEDSDFTFATPNRTEACDFAFATVNSTEAFNRFTFPPATKFSTAHSTNASGSSSSAAATRTTRTTRTTRNVRGGGGGLVCVGKSNRGVTWGFSLSQGMQATMEDAICIVPGILRLPCPAVGGCRAPHCSFSTEESPVHYFGLFDGHGGSQVSHYCSMRLHKLLAEEWEREDSEENWSSKWEIALSRAFNRADDAFKDRALAPYTVGSTALVVLLSACQIIVANCGDSRAVLCRGGQAIPLTSDQKLDREDEEARVIRGGGRILYLGCPRVEGILSMTRAIGDQDLKQWVISEPEVTFFSRTEEDECLILASDGLWDVMSNEEVMGFARRMLKEQRRLFAMGSNGSSCPAQYVAQEVVTHALRTSSDNVSVIVVDLKRLRRRHQPKAADTCR